LICNEILTLCFEDLLNKVRSGRNLKHVSSNKTAMKQIIVAKMRILGKTGFQIKVGR